MYRVMGGVTPTKFDGQGSYTREQALATFKRLFRSISEAKALEEGRAVSLLTNFYPEESFRFTVCPTVLLAEGKATADDMAYLYCTLSCTAHRDKVCDVVEARAKDGTFRIELSLENVKDGTYYFNVFKNSRQNGTFSSYLYNELIVCVEGGEVWFEVPGAYERNLDVQTSALKKQYSQPSAMVQSKDKNISALSKQLCTGLNTEYEKAKAIHDWVAENIYYDYDAYEKSTETAVDAVSVLKEKRAVCQGYAYLTAALLRASGIPCRVVVGIAMQSGFYANANDLLATATEENHAWVQAYVDGRWIHIDSTWSSLNEYRDGEFIKAGMSSSRYFDPSRLFFSFDHVELGEDAA